MRFVPSVATAVATGALMVAIPAAASASAPASLPTSGGAPAASSGGYAKVADGQTVAQVQQEMGNAGQFSQGLEKDGTDTTYLSWTSSSLGGLVKYTVTFSANSGGPALVYGKSALPLI